LRIQLIMWNLNRISVKYNRIVKISRAKKIPLNGMLYANYKGINHIFHVVTTKITHSNIRLYFMKRKYSSVSYGLYYASAIYYAMDSSSSYFFYGSSWSLFWRMLLFSALDSGLLSNFSFSS
jgi:hypothetical protein